MTDSSAHRCPKCGYVAEEPGGAKVCSPATIVAALPRSLLTTKQENFVLVLLDSRHHIVGRPRIVMRGILDASLVHPREVFAPALKARAAAIVVAHNHPSGDPEPSPEDIATTERLEGAGKILGIPVLDHIIIGWGGRWVSLAARGYLNR